MSNHSILIIDDERLVLEKAAAALRKVGCTVHVSHDADVPDGVDPRAVDLVLLDVNMPNFFGDDLVHILPELGITAPIYLYSGIDEPQLQDLAKRSGAQGYITKQLSFVQMADEVLAILASRR